MKSRICILILFTLYLVSCRNVFKGCDNTCIINRSLESEVNKVILGGYDSLLNSKYPIIIVAFTKVDDTCFISVIPSPFINENRIRGYFKLNRKIIAVWFDSLDCINGFISPECLLTDLTKIQFVTQDDFYKDIAFFDPKGLKFMVTSKRNIVLVHRGMF